MDEKATHKKRSNFEVSGYAFTSEEVDEILLLLWPHVWLFGIGTVNFSGCPRMGFILKKDGKYCDRIRN